MSAKNVEILVESQNFKELRNQKKKTYGREPETNTEKRKKFQWTEEIVQYLLSSQKRYKLTYNFSEKDFDTDKTVLDSKLRKEMAKKYEGFGPIETSANPRAD